MFQFRKEQIVYDIAGVKVGGNPGENSAVMIGSMFYKGDKIICDEKTGDFDRKAGEELINKVEELSDRTGLSSMLDVVCISAQIARKYLEFAADVTRMPILIDAVSEEAALGGMESAGELGIVGRTLFNSITPDTKDQVYGKMKEVGIDSAIVLTYSTKAIISSKERIRLLETLLPRLETAGIKKILVDTVVMDIATLGLACKAIYEVKDKFGYPAGCGAHNAVDSWKSLKEKKDKQLTMTVTAVADGLPIAVGADFILYGPVKAAEYVFPGVGVINAAYGQAFMEEGKRLGPGHPRFKIARF